MVEKPDVTTLPAWKELDSAFHTVARLPLAWDRDKRPSAETVMEETRKHLTSKKRQQPRNRNRGIVKPPPLLTCVSPISGEGKEFFLLYSFVVMKKNNNTQIKIG